ncbi:PAX-interacting protein 1-like [Gigantopelta aegis]|uniref:PAX-interacting protein 1-like n=1 Tax=Gigantopelta aegis TaxID=1735272 RepID=UPI001B889651|nr:PAX-interacting protein 1-like [Gigantopelta aegis]
MMGDESYHDLINNVPKDFFKNVIYYIVGDISDNIMKLLNAGGAKRDTYLSEMVSHVIADTTDHDEYSEAKELFELPVVRSEWVTLSVQCKQLLPKERFALEGLLFSGIVVCASQLDESDAKAVWGMVVYHGGHCQHKLDKKVTHLITPFTTSRKYEEAKNHESIKIVCPDWVMESVSKNTLQDELVYHPHLVMYKPDTPPAPPTPEPEPEPDIPQQLQRSLAISPGPGQQMAQQIVTGLRRKSSSEDSPRNGSRPGTPSSSAKEALARMVSSRLQASGKVVDSPDPRLTPPAMVFPHGSPRTATPHAHPQELLQPVNRTLKNITNNVEPPRPAVARIQQKLGMPPVRHGHPLPGYPHQPLQGLPVHTPQSIPQYWGHDPSDSVPPDMCLLGCVFFVTDYQKILGQEEIDTWKQVIEQHGGQVDVSYSSRVTHILCANQQSDVFVVALKDQRRLVTAFWLNDVLLEKRMIPPWQALHLPLVFWDQKPCSNQVMSITNFDGEERKRIKQMINSIGAKYTGYMTHTNSVLVAKKPEGSKYTKAKEWRIPVVNVSWLSDLVVGHLDALRLPIHTRYLQHSQGKDFLLDLSRVPHLMIGWKSPLKISKEAWKRFIPRPKPVPEPDKENGSHKRTLSENGKEEPNSKRSRLNTEGDDGSKPRVLFTGFPYSVSKKLTAIVEDLGGLVVTNPKECTHLVTQVIARTMKFFVAINVCKFIVTKTWLEESLLQHRFLDEEKYFLNDEKGETELGCRLSESVRKARSNPLFKGLTFHITPGVIPPVVDIRNIVESAGGQVVQRRPSAKTIAAQVDDKGHPTFIIITCVKDVFLCRDLVAKRIAVYNPEFVLTGVIRQEVDFELFRLDIPTS